MKNLLDDQGKTCPDCPNTLHVGQEKFSDGLYVVEYCNQCGYRLEQPMQK